MKRDTAAIILAGGMGQRMGGIFKQFFPIHGKPILFYSLEKFLKLDFIYQIIIVLPEEKIIFGSRLVNESYKDLRIRFVAGGKTRKDSTFSALEYIKASQRGGQEIEHVIVHDAARPDISQTDLTALRKSMVKWGAAVSGIKALDIPLRVKDGFVVGVLNKEKEGMYAGYTPQCFRFNELYTAYKKVEKIRGFDSAADNLEILFSAKSKLRVRMVDVEPSHKITYPTDLDRFDGRISKRVSEKIKRKSVQ